jgi:hypothetical protein
VIRIGNSWADAVLTPANVGAGDRLPVGCAVLVIVALSLLLWVILLIPLLWLFHGIADVRGTTSRRAGSAVGKLAGGWSFRLWDPARPLGHADHHV